MHYLNKLRLQAGLTIKPELEVTIKPPVVEPVIEAEVETEELVWEAVNLQFGVDGNGPFNVINNKGEIHDTYETKEEAQSVAKKLNAKYNNREDELKEDHFQKGDMVNLIAKNHDYKVVDSIGEGEEEKYKVECPVTGKEHTYKASELKKSDKTAEEVEYAIRHQLGEGKKADKDYDKDGEVESSEEEHKGAVDKAVKKEKGKKDKSEEVVEEECEMSEGVTTIFDNIVDKDENPKPNKDEQSIAKGNEKVACPAKLLNSLKAEAKEAEKESEYYTDRDAKTSAFYSNLAVAMMTLHDRLKEGTHESMQRAQIEFSSWMSIMQHKVPSEVVDFIMKGGKTTSLKDFYKEVKMKK